MLYIYMGSETFVDEQNNGAADGTITIGYSNSHAQGPFTRAIRLTGIRRVHDQRQPQYLLGLESQYI